MTDSTPTAEQPTAGATWLTLSFALGAALLAATLRLLPHPANVTMLGALGLWGGSRLKPWLGVCLPLIVWGVTDVILWRVYDSPPFNPFVYGSFILYSLFGVTLRHTRSTLRIGATTLGASVLFFVVTNLGVWVTSWKSADRVPEGLAFVEERGEFDYPTIYYSADLKGLAACYALAVPFIRSEGMPVPAPLGFLGNTVAGDLFFCGMLFGMHAVLLRIASRRQPALAPIVHR